MPLDYDLIFINKIDNKKKYCLRIQDMWDINKFKQGNNNYKIPSLLVRDGVVYDEGRAQRELLN